MTTDRHPNSDRRKSEPMKELAIVREIYSYVADGRVLNAIVVLRRYADFQASSAPQVGAKGSTEARRETALSSVNNAVAASPQAERQVLDAEARAGASVQCETGAAAKAETQSEKIAGEAVSGTRPVKPLKPAVYGAAPEVSPSPRNDPRARVRGQIRCPLCDKALSVETNDEECPKSLYRHGKHPIFIVADSPSPQQVPAAAQAPKCRTQGCPNAVLTNLSGEPIAALCGKCWREGAEAGNEHYRKMKADMEALEFSKSLAEVEALLVKKEQQLKDSFCSDHLASLEDLPEGHECVQCAAEHALAQSAELRKEIAQLQENLAASRSDANAYWQELTRLRRELEQEQYQFKVYREAWIRELGGKVVPKHHDIDSLVLTTRKLVERAEAAEKALQQRWIPVSVRLPEMNGANYLTFNQGEVDIDSASNQASWHQGFITHWQPLPSAPEKK